eukprot:1730248-Pyramimonas_sp.AAC.1
MMSIPAPVLRFYQMMYEDSIAQITISSRRYDWIAITSGVKQGCPASMQLFVLAVDPLLRWLGHRCSLNISIHLAYADDFLFGLANTLRDLGPVLSSLMLLEKIANL